MTNKDRMLVTRRSLVAGLPAVVVMPGGAHAALPAPSVAPELTDAGWRGLARMLDLPDPVLSARAREALARLDVDDAEAANLVRLYRRHERRSSFRHDGALPRQVAKPDLITLHAAIRDRRSVTFRYTALDGVETERTVLPIALVHPPQGVKLLAWCGLRDAGRQFFVGAMTALRPGASGFAARRADLLRRMVEEDGWPG